MNCHCMLSIYSCNIPLVFCILIRSLVFFAVWILDGRYIINISENRILITLLVIIYIARCDLFLDVVDCKKQKRARNVVGDKRLELV